MLKKDKCVQIKRAHCGLYANINKQHILVIFMNSKDKRKILQTFKERERGWKERNVAKELE